MKEVIEIAVDSRGVEQGLTAANRALDETATKADKAEREVEQLGHAGRDAGHNMSAAFAATGGGLAITHGLEGISSGLRSGNSAMAAFAASQALLDLGRFAEDMKGVAAATGTATTVFGRMGAIMKAHPLMTIATVLAGAASAMAIFHKDTEKVADAFDRLGDKMRALQISAGARQMLGLPVDTAELGRQRQQQIIGLTEQFAGQTRGQGITYQQMSTALGGQFSPSQLQQMGVDIMGEQHPRAIARRAGVQAVMAQQRREEFGTVDRRVAQAILRTLYRQLESEAKQLQAQGPAAVGAGTAAAPGGQPFDIFSVGQAGQPFTRDGVLYPQGFGTGEMLMRKPGMPGTFGYERPMGPQPGGQVFSPAMQRQAERLNRPMGPQPGGQVFSPAMEDQFEAIKQAEADAAAAMDQLIAKGEEFGMIIGDAFFRVAEGTMTARQAMAELVRTFAQMAAQQAFRGIGGAVAGSFAPTQAQTGTTAPATP